VNACGVCDGKYVFTGCSSPRREYNHALEYAVQEANRLKKSLRVVFGLTDQYPDANRRHYRFMLEGLQETAAALLKRGIPLAVQFGSPPQVVLTAGKEAALIVCDRGYLRHQGDWRREVAAAASCRVIQVESDVIVPVEVVSDKAEYAARTIRPKITKHLPDYLVGLLPTPLQKPSRPLEIGGLDLADLSAVLKRMKLDGSAAPVSNRYRGGAGRAEKLFRDFLQNRLRRYRQNSNQPQTDDISQMSPYRISAKYPLWQLAAELEKSTADPDKTKRPSWKS
jgi:deoxyribodipyrimidine photo-lyase